MTNWTSTTTGTGEQNWSTSTKPQHPGNTFYARGFEGITSADSFLTYNNPITIPTSGQTFLNFSDWDNNEGDDNVIVEVSTDGGTNWQSATGTQNWSFTWIPTQTGAATVKVRAFGELSAGSKGGARLNPGLDGLIGLLMLPATFEASAC